MFRASRIFLIATFLLSSAVYGAIYDCFLFFNEFEILEIRLNELYPHVDKFVLVEAAETFQGNPKPLYFWENKHRFKKFLPKIIHIMVLEHFEAPSPWDREFFQRNQIMRGLNCQGNDVILISDLDEIPSARKLSDLIRPLSQDPLQVTTAAMKYYGYYLNRLYTPVWHGTVATSFQFLCNHSPQGVRCMRGTNVVSNAGWHLSWMGGIDRQICKIESFSHAEMNNDHVKNRMRLLQEMRSGIFEEIDETFPEFVQFNQEYFKRLGFLYFPSEQ